MKLIKVANPTYNGIPVIIATKALDSFGVYINSLVFNFDFDHAAAFVK